MTRPNGHRVPTAVEAEIAAKRCSIVRVSVMDVAGAVGAVMAYHSGKKTTRSQTRGPGSHLAGARSYRVVSVPRAGRSPSRFAGASGLFSAPAAGSTSRCGRMVAIWVAGVRWVEAPLAVALWPSVSEEIPLLRTTRISPDVLRACFVLGRT